MRSRFALEGHPLHPMLVAAFLAAFLLMLNDGATSGVPLVLVVVLQAAGVGLLSMAGWLGGEMVFRHHLAMVPDNEDFARAEHVRHEFQPHMRDR
jgi:uncharacterized membrane protein